MVPTKHICRLALVGCLALHVMCRKHASYKVPKHFRQSVSLIGTNLDTTVSIVNMCRKMFLHTSAGKFSPHGCKMVHKCRKILYTRVQNGRKILYTQMQNAAQVQLGNFQHIL